MNKVKLLFISLVLLCTSILVLLANKEESITTYKHSFELLEQTKWKSNISELDKVEIENALKNQIIEAQIAAIKCAAVFNEIEFLNIIRENKEKYSGFVYESTLLIFDAVETGNDYNTSLLSKVKVDDLTKNLKVGLSHHYSISDLLLDILVVRKCKALRKVDNNEFLLPAELLNEYQAQLINYSSRETEGAITELINEINFYDETELMRRQEFVNLLFTYGEKGVNKVIDLVFDRNEIENISNNGMPYLITLLNRNFNLISNGKKQKIKKFLTSENKEKYFNSNSQLLFPMIYFEGMLNNLSKEEIQSKIQSKIPLEEKRKEQEKIDSIINDIKSKQRKVIVPDQPKEPSRSYPEERGEDFSKKSTTTLINYLKQADFNEVYNQEFHHQSEKAIELRKVANALGDRYLAGDLSVTSEQKQVINQLVLKYIKMSYSGNPQDFKESKLQMIRFSGVIVPSLFQKLLSDDPYVSNFAAQTLVDMKNEEITEQFIQKVFATTDMKKKKELYRFLELFQYPDQTHLKNRPAQDAETTKRLYTNLVVPAMEKLKKELE